MRLQKARPAVSSAGKNAAKTPEMVQHNRIIDKCIRITDEIPQRLQKRFLPFTSPVRILQLLQPAAELLSGDNSTEPSQVKASGVPPHSPSKTGRPRKGEGRRAETGRSFAASRKASLYIPSFRSMRKAPLISVPASAGCVKRASTGESLDEV